MTKTMGVGRGALRLVALAAFSTLSGAGFAMEFETGNPELSIRWDNTIKYSAAWRARAADSALLGHPNADDGNRNFGKGLVSSRVDLQTELDVVWAKSQGLRLSAAGWYDAIYNRRNDNPGFAGHAFPNRLSPHYNEFSGETRDIHGRQAEVLDAFVFGSVDLGSTRASLRLGQFAQIWGESVFFGANGIAGGMSPVDVNRLVSVPGTQFKEALLPVPQVSAQWQLTNSLTASAYYQFRWRANRLPGVGSYFSGADTSPQGGEQLLLAGPGSPFAANAPRLGDQKARDSGQGGLSLRIRGEDSDFGVYLIRFHDKSFQQVMSIGLARAAGGGVRPGPIGYRLVYPEAVTALGASATRTFGDLNLAAEASIRRDQALASSSSSVDTSFFGGPPADNTDHPGYAKGRTAHLNVSALWTVPRTALFNEATFLGEVAWNRVLSVTDHASAVDVNSTRDAVSLRFQFEPQYRQVLSGLDLGLPIGLGWSPKGSRSRALGLAVPPDNGGDLTVGVNGTYLGVWKFGLAYTQFFGPGGTLLDANNNFSYRQFMRDRSFFAASLSRTL